MLVFSYTSQNLHIEEFIKGSTQKGYNRTTFGKFLSEGVWNIDFAWKSIRKFVVHKIYECSSGKKGLPYSIERYKKGYRLIDALKTNRISYPKGINIQIK
jgi:hypothetical protein